jgi:hypothetical protein
MWMTRGFYLGCIASSTLLLLAAAPSWLSKDPSEWTDKDASAVVSDSPWAKVVVLPPSARPGSTILETGAADGSATASLGNPPTAPNNSSNGGYPVAGSPVGQRPNVPTPSAMPPSAAAPAPPNSVTIVWASALPVRLAQLHFRLHGNAPTEEQSAAARRTRDHYVIAVLGLPEPDDPAKVEKLAERTSLQPRGKAKIAALRADFRKVGTTNVYLFRFPKTAPLTIEDGQVEFQVMFGTMELKKKFDLRDMQYQGKLEL